MTLVDGLPRPLGSYPREDVTFLLTDIGDRITEQAVEHREELLRSGARHYSETLAAERPLSPAYRALVMDLLEDRAPEVASLVAVLGERVLGERGPGVVLVSLARAGTPVGVLVRRWLAWRHALRVPHYSVSIIRDRGIDMVAMRWLARHHDPATLQLVDGWTGKGVICREVAAALPGLASEGIALTPAVAVLADPGHCTPLCATRDDVLIPSACLNATIPGLVSRTVLDRSLLGPDDFHGVKWYRDRAGEDLSNAWVDRVASHFPQAAEEVDGRLTTLAGLPPPDGRGLRDARALMAELGVSDLNHVKPGVGEATRVLLRRVPRCVVVDPGRDGELAHLRMLAAERGVPVVERRGGVFACAAAIADAGA
ncbi:MAG TPA: cysteine protease StiP domain-containing protein [Candidatus Dormibacteraeota bacterium]|nr:cysteine protease StiP domain-containing protein [Candidatus Dormibacteraeota bacterium]